MPLVRKHPTIFSIILLAILPMLFLWRVVFLGDVLLALDVLSTYEPWQSETPDAAALPVWNGRTSDTVRHQYGFALFVKESWQNGEIPLWYPYNGLGMPFFANPQIQILYPINNILWQLLPIHYGLGWSAILHLFMGSVFTFLFLRELGVHHFGRLVAAIAFTYGSSSIQYLGLPNLIDTMMWTPGIFWTIEGAIQRKSLRWSVLAAFGVAMQLLAGQVQLVMYTFTAISLYAICRCWIGWRSEGQTGISIFAPLFYIFIALVLGSGLVAFQILPVAEMVPMIIRRIEEIPEPDSALVLLRMLIPDLFGNPLDGEVMPVYHYEAYLYIGLLPLFFMMAALFSPRAWLAGALIGIGLLFLLVIVKTPPFYQLFYYFYPTFRSLGLSRIVFIVILLWSTAAGIGADWLLIQRPQAALFWLIRLGLVLGAMAVIYVVAILFLEKYQARYYWSLPQLPEFQPSTIYHLAGVIFFLVFLAAILALLWAWSTSRISVSFFITASITVLVVDLFLAHIDFMPTLPLQMLFPTTPSLTSLLETAGQNNQPYRVAGSERALWPNTGGVFFIPTVQIYDSFLSRRYFEYADASGARDRANFRIIAYTADSSPLLDALNTKYLYTSREALATGEGTPLLDDLSRTHIASDVAEAGQAEEWSINNWRQKVVVAPAPTTIDYPGMLPKNSRLETAIAIDPQHWEADGVLFEIFATSATQQSPTLLFSRLLSPRDNPADRQWVPVEVDLSAFTGQPMLFSLVTKPQHGPGSRGGWANPMLVDADRWDLVYYGVNSIYENKLALPRAWLVHKAREIAVGDLAAARAYLENPDVDLSNEAIVEGSLPDRLPDTITEIPPGEVTIISYRPNRIEISASLDVPGLLVLSDLYYPGWQATVDDQPLPVLATNLIMRGVYLAAGTHTVVFTLEPASFWWGIYISLGLLVIMVLVLSATWLWPGRNLYRGKIARLRDRT